jgi:hypothetical protein
MTDATTAARAAIAELSSKDDDELYRLLALRVKAMQRDPTTAGQLSPMVSDADAMGIAFVDLVKFGKATFGRLALAGHSVVCGDGADEGNRLARLLATANKDVATVTATVAALLVGQLAIAPAIAGIVATIIIGKVAPTSLDALCRVWAARLPAQPAGPGGGTTSPQTQPTPPAEPMPPAEPPR